MPDLLILAFKAFPIILLAFVCLWFFLSIPFGIIKKTKYLFIVFVFFTKSAVHNTIAIAKLIKRRGAKSAFHRYPKTTSFIIGFLPLAVIISLIFISILKMIFFN